MIGKTPDYAERGEIIRAAYAVEWRVGPVSDVGVSARRQNLLRNRMPCGDAVFGAARFENGGFVIWQSCIQQCVARAAETQQKRVLRVGQVGAFGKGMACLLYTSDAADE